jgi:structural maintenance of chromosomes protein 5
VEASVRLIEADSELATLKEEHEHILTQLGEQKQAVQTLSAKLRAVTREHNDLCARHQAVLNSLTEEEREIIEEYQHLQTIQELTTEIETTQNHLGLLGEGNPHAIHAYQKREQDIETTEAKLAKLAEDLQTTHQKIEDIKSRWEPELEALVEKISEGFSHNFQQIGCAGQVGIYKDEDFENWSIQIQVRFR